jgi:hypothetical protein
MRRYLFSLALVPLFLFLPAQRADAFVHLHIGLPGIFSFGIGVPGAYASPYYGPGYSPYYGPGYYNDDYYDDGYYGAPYGYGSPYYYGGPSFYFSPFFGDYDDFHHHHGHDFDHHGHGMILITTSTAAMAGVWTSGACAPR